MKIIYYALIIVLVVFYSCNSNKSEDNNKKSKERNVYSIITELEKNDFYKKYFGFTIGVRDPGVYVIVTKTMGEFWVWYNGGEVTFGKDESTVTKKLKSLYPETYLAEKKRILADLNELINFNMKKDIRGGGSHLDENKIHFSIDDSLEFIAYKDLIPDRDLKFYQIHYDSVETLKKRWVILREL